MCTSYYILHLWKKISTYEICNASWWLSKTSPDNAGFFWKTVLNWIVSEDYKYPYIKPVYVKGQITLQESCTLHWQFQVLESELPTLKKYALGKKKSRKKNMPLTKTSGKKTCHANLHLILLICTLFHCKPSSSLQKVYKSDITHFQLSS